MSEDIKDVLVYMVLPVAISLLVISIYCGVQFEEPLCWVKNQCYTHVGTEKLECHNNDYGTIKLEEVKNEKKNN